MKKQPGTNQHLYSMIAGYEVNIQKSITFLYTSNKQAEFEIQTQYHLNKHFKK